MSHGLYTNQAHYMPTSGEISAMKIQGEGRNWPDAGLVFTPGQCGYDESQSTNPTTMTCPVEMSMQENRYRRMLTPDGTHIQSYVSSSYGSGATRKYHEAYSPPSGDKLHPTSEVKWSDFYGKNKVYKVQSDIGIYTGNANNRYSTEQAWYFSGDNTVGVSKSGHSIINYGGFVGGGFTNWTDAAGFTTGSNSGGTFRSHQSNPTQTSWTLSIMSQYLGDRKANGTRQNAFYPRFGSLVHLLWYRDNVAGLGFSNYCVSLTILGRCYADDKAIYGIHWPDTYAHAGYNAYNGTYDPNNWYATGNASNIHGGGIFGGGGDVSYEAPKASNLYFGQTTFRSTYTGGLPETLNSHPMHSIGLEHSIGISAFAGGYSETT